MACGINFCEKIWRVWAALAPSDFHNEEIDFWPGQFSETWVYASDRSVVSVLAALRSGSFFASHGGLAREVELLVEAKGLSRAAGPGETIAVPAGHTIDVSLRMVRPETDLQGNPNRIDVIELIGVTSQDCRVVGKAEGSQSLAPLLTGYSVPADGIVLRARGWREMPGGPRLQFYTNPVRVNRF